MTISLNLTHNLNQLLSNLKLPICLKDYLEVAERCEKEKLSHIEFFGMVQNQWTLTLFFVVIFESSHRPTN